MPTYGLFPVYQQDHEGAYATKGPIENISSVSIPFSSAVAITRRSNPCFLLILPYFLILSQQLFIRRQNSFLVRMFFAYLIPYATFYSFLVVLNCRFISLGKDHSCLCDHKMIKSKIMVQDCRNKKL